MFYRTKGRPWEGEFEAADDEEAVLKQIQHNMKWWGSEMTKLDTVIKYCLNKGIENSEAILLRLYREKKVTCPKKGFIGLG